MQTAGTREELQGLLEKIHRERGFDFREYRETTLTRRLGRRLRARGVETYADYARILSQHSDEYDKLFNDLTINVTSFFRDEVAFKALEDIALPAVIEKRDRPAGARPCVRIWSAGCATGQEPYSIAMLLVEMLGSQISLWDTTILATDIDATALKHAREGFFAEKDVQDLRSELLNTHFVPEDNGFRVRPILKHLVTFWAHDLTSHMPYRDLDLVVCRNVLIYFTPALQTRVLEGFHEGLKDGGFLLLGKAEVPVGETGKLFHCIDKKAKLYRSIGFRA